MGGTGGGGPTMCHNILLPSKGSNEWRNIPFKLKNNYCVTLNMPKQVCYMPSMIVNILGLGCLFGPFMFKSINIKEKTSNTKTVSYNMGSSPFGLQCHWGSCDC